MYSECLKCAKLGNGCDGPNFMAMSPEMLVKWISARMTSLGLTNQRVADKSGVPKGTIDSIRAGKRYNFEFNTLQPILQYLVGSSWGGDPCPFPPDVTVGIVEENNKLTERCIQLAEQISELRDLVATYKDQVAFYKKEVTMLNKKIKELEKGL